MAKDILRLDKAVCHNFDLPRSAAQKFIKQGFVSVNGEIILSPETKIHIDDVIAMDGDEVSANEGFKKRVYMLNKPSGYICADRDNNNPLVVNLFADLPKYTELHCVGRLDIDTTGLILLTDDGDLNHKITSPKFEVTKTYLATVKNPLRERDIELFKRGLKHPEEKSRYKPALLEIVSEQEAKVTVTEGRFHEVKRLFECVDNEVIELKRLAIGSLILDENLDEGEYKELDNTDLELIFNPYKP